MYRIFVYVMLFLGIVLTGCGTASDNTGTGTVGGESPDEKEVAHLTGLIYSMTERTILVVAGIDNVDMDEEDWQGKDAISFSITDDTELVDANGDTLSFSDLQVGDEVEAWHTGDVMESYPMQAEAVKIRKLK